MTNLIKTKKDILIQNKIIDEGVDMKDNNKLMDTLKDKLKCNTEKCVAKELNKMDIFSDINSNIQKVSNKSEHIDVVDIYFKPNGPTDTKLFSNINIDNVLKHFELAFPYFYHIDFLMNDWENAPDDHPIFNLLTEKDNTMCALLKKEENDVSVNIEEKDKDINKLLNKVADGKKTCYGCVLNIDYYSGPGTHWVAMFIDLRDKNNPTIEYFNTSGNNPPKNFTNLILKIKDKLESGRCISENVKIVQVTKKEIQKSDTECGPYSVFYIYERLRGTPYTYFNGIDYERVKDEIVTIFRKYLFYTTEDEKNDKK
jgi:hypothetical protein